MAPRGLRKKDIFLAVLFVGIMAGGCFLVFSGVGEEVRTEREKAASGALPVVAPAPPESGRAEVSEPPSGPRTGKRSGHPGEAVSGLPPSVAAGDDPPEMAGDFGIDGVVFARDSGLPLAGCRVHFRERVVETGADGEFELWSDGGVGRLRFSCPGYKSEAINHFDNRVGEGIAHMDVFLEPRDGAGRGRIEINGVNGRVYDRENGAPLSGVRIAIGQRRTRSDAAGFFELWGNDSTLSTLQAAAPGYINEMVSGIDFTNQANPFFLEISLQRNRQGKFHLALVGIGARLARERDSYMVAEVLRNSPAAREGLRAGDRLVAVDNLAVDDFSLREVIELIRGREGRPVKLMVERDGDFLEFTCVRERVVY